jgi:NADPH:quinone reductase
MLAIVLGGFGGFENLAIKELRNPEPKPGHVLVAVKAFGVNHAETHMRKGEWAEAAEVSGIECVGEVVAAPGGEFQPGDKVAAFMGGMGRTINGSYAELTLVPATNVVKITTDLSWEEFAVIPESYATAWLLLSTRPLSTGLTSMRLNSESVLETSWAISHSGASIHLPRTFE